MARKSKRTRARDEIVYGTHPVAECLGAAPDRAQRLLVSSAREEIVSLAREHGVEVEETTQEALDSLCQGGNHQGVALITLPFAYTDLSEVLEKIEHDDEALIVVLDGVQDPGNLGAIVRSAAAFGAAAVVIAKDRAAGVTGAVIRASAGQAWRVPIIEVTNLSRAIDALKAQRFWVVGTPVRPQGAQLPWEVEMSGTRIALVIGGEAQGMRRLVTESCDFLVTIPMAQGVESLNAASAATAMMYEVQRQWQGRNKGERDQD